jgi:ATP-dependent DNA helicase PIF1
MTTSTNTEKILSLEQQIAFDKYIQKENIFITGSGGSGKSALIKIIYEDAIRRGKKISVTALTGCAAVLLNCKAKTIHSWAGIGLGTDSLESLATKISNNRFKKKTWREIDILVIDEISMMSVLIFELLDQLGKELRRNRLPFGGIQIIMSGDFYQLPPVPSTNFCFESEFWPATFKPDSHIQLIHIFRQTDMTFVSLLNQIREGKIKRKTVELLERHVGRKVPEDSLIQPTKIYPLRSQVDQVNILEMTKLTGKIYDYKLKKPLVQKEEHEHELKYMEQSLLCDTTIRLRIGAQIMCIVNIELEGITLCNGSLGIFTGINEVTGLPRVRFNGVSFDITMPYHAWTSEKYPDVSISQIPIILAWAITIHKSQGASLEMAEIDIGENIFECGQTYVALSRVKSLEGLYLKSFDVSKICINRKVKLFYDSIIYDRIS